MHQSNLSGTRFLIFGAARSGIAAAKLLKRHGAAVLLLDEKPAPPPELLQELASADIEALWGAATQTAPLDPSSIMVKSPGIPQTNAMVMEARRRGARVISEIELAAAFQPSGASLIAITGTNGKTTTTAWTAHILNACGFHAIAAGNIGDAWSNVVDAADVGVPPVFVVECSSFQLEDLEDFRPDIALLTNFSPDHMDRYMALEDYWNAKRNLVRNMGAGQRVIINADDPASAPFAAGSTAQVYTFSKQPPSDPATAGGMFVEEGWIAFRNGTGAAEPISPVSALPLPGAHNLENALAAALCARLQGGAPAGIRIGLESFAGVEHRIEFCGRRESDGVRFYNDSKATNVDSTEKALKAFEQEKIVLIAGGRDKHTGYVPLRELVQQRVRRLITLGEAAPLIEAELASLTGTERAADMPDAVRRAAAAALPGDVVLLSPACASYDMYNNYEERGRDFKARVAALLKAE